MAYTYFDDFGGWVKKRVVSREKEEELERERKQAGLAPEPAWGGLRAALDGRSGGQVWHQ